MLNIVPPAGEDDEVPCEKDETEDEVDVESASSGSMVGFNQLTFIVTYFAKPIHPLIETL